MYYFITHPVTPYDESTEHARNLAFDTLDLAVYVLFNTANDICQIRTLRKSAQEAYFSASPTLSAAQNALHWVKLDEQASHGTRVIDKIQGHLTEMDYDGHVPCEEACLKMGERLLAAQRLIESAVEGKLVDEKDYRTEDIEVELDSDSTYIVSAPDLQDERKQEARFSEETFPQTTPHEHLAPEAMFRVADFPRGHIIDGPYLDARPTGSEARDFFNDIFHYGVTSEVQAEKDLRAATNARLYAYRFLECSDHTPEEYSLHAENAALATKLERQASDAVRLCRHYTKVLQDSRSAGEVLTRRAYRNMEHMFQQGALLAEKAARGELAKRW